MRSANERIASHGRFYKLCAFCILMGMFAGCRGPQRTTLVVSVAASLQDAIAEAEADYKRSHTNIDFSNNLGSSNTLSRQIAQGAPVDVFLSAAAKPMDELEQKSLLAAGTRRNLLCNSLVLIAPRDSRLQDFQGLAGKSVRLIALGDPASVPAGQYGRQSLLSLHLWETLNAKLVLGRDVRQVLTYVETGNADAGLVYATDALSSGNVRIVATVPESAHDPIVYPAAAIKGSHGEQAGRQFIDYLAGPAAQAIFQKHGFRMAIP
jgi:molybdate transport system substrate-binding protein